MQKHKDVPKGVQSDHSTDNHHSMEKAWKSDQKILQVQYHPFHERVNQTAVCSNREHEVETESRLSINLNQVSKTVLPHRASRYLKAVVSSALQSDPKDGP